MQPLARLLCSRLTTPPRSPSVRNRGSALAASAQRAGPTASARPNRSRVRIRPIRISRKGSCAASRSSVRLITPIRCASFPGKRSIELGPTFGCHLRFEARADLNFQIEFSWKDQVASSAPIASNAASIGGGFGKCVRRNSRSLARCLHLFASKHRERPSCTRNGVTAVYLLRSAQYQFCNCGVLYLYACRCSTCIKHHGGHHGQESEEGKEEDWQEEKEVGLTDTLSLLRHIKARARLCHREADIAAA
jgi:hypothetical protein